MSNIDTRISPALDPETYRAVEGYNDSTRGQVDDVIGAFNDIYTTLSKLHDASELWRRNPATTEEQAILIVGKEAAKQKERVARRFDRACADLGARIAHTEGELSRPLVQQAALGNLNAEVRAHAKGLERPERTKMMNEAMAADSDDVVTAILGAPHFLSGLSAEDHAWFTRKYHEKKSPHLVARLDVMVRVRDLLDTNGANGPVFHRAFEKAVGARPNDVNAISKANEAALAALKIEPTD